MVKKANQFRNLKELEKYVKNNVPNNISRSTKLERTLAGFMKQSVYNEVYMGYLPKDLESRRWARGKGLGYEGNMRITDMKLEDSELQIVFENLTQGRDSLSGQYLTDTIEEGIRSNWDEPDLTDVYGRRPSDPRPFVAETANMIRKEPERVKEAVKKAFKEAGFKIK